MTPSVTIAVLILSTLAASPTAAAGPSPAPGAVRAEEVFACDFEDAADQDFDGWPDGWTREHSRRFPEYVRVGIVPLGAVQMSASKWQGRETSPQRGRETLPQPGGQYVPTALPEKAEPLPGGRVLEIELDGGGAMVSSPPFPVSPQFSLLVSAQIKVQGLAHDGAWVTLTLLDGEGEVLERHSSPPVSGGDGWETVRIGPFAAPTNRVARGIVSLTLAPLARAEDLTGKAWFDGLRIARLPRMELAVNSPTGLFTPREKPELVCEVSGICVPDPQLRFELFDHTGQRLAEHLAPLIPTHEPSGGGAGALPPDGFAGHANWVPPLPDFGFYRVRTSLVGKGSDEVLLDRTRTLALLRPLGAAPRGIFGWSLPGEDLPYSFSTLTALLKQAGLGWAKLPVWYDARDTARADRIAWFAEQLSIDGIELVGVFDQPPKELREVFREQGKLPMAIVFSETALWQPAVAPVMTRLSLKVHWWQLGDDQDASFIGYPGLAAKMAEIKRQLQQYGQQVHIGLNWRWNFAPPDGGGRAPWSYLSYDIEPPLTADELAAHLAPSPERKRGSGPAAGEWLAPSPGGTRPVKGLVGIRDVFPPPGVDPPPRRWVLLPPLPRQGYSTEVRVHDLVLRMLAARIHGADAAFVPQPFDSEQGVLHPDGSPAELFVPWRTTATLIGAADYLGPLQLPGGNVGHVFAAGGSAVMAVWADRPATEYLLLGDEIDQIDVWGRSRKPARVERDGAAQREITIGTLPSFVTGLSEAVARWQTGLAFEDVQLSSVAGRPQTIVLRMRNTFPQAVSGELTLHAPKSWDVDPRPTRFKLPEGGEIRLPLSVTISSEANSGPQPVRLDFDVGGQRFSAYRTLQLGLDDVQIELTTRLTKEGTLRVEQSLTNLSDRPLNFRCVLFPPGRRRETRQVLNLGRDRTTLTFVLPRGEELIGKKLWLRAEEIGGSRVLNYTVVAER